MLFAAGLLSGLVLAGILVLLYQPRASGNLGIATPTPAPIKVHVLGAVAHPGVYELYPGARVEQALEAAGGLLETADLTRVNLAQRLRDEMQVFVPSKASGAGLSGGLGSLPASGDGTKKVNVNLASADELEALPGIGPVLAQRIVQYREQNGPYNGPEDLVKVRGISRSMVERLANQISY
jgi:competence protein ComEA